MAQPRVFQLTRTTAIGLCGLEDSRIWDGENDRNRTYAKTACGRCPIQVTCLANAMEEEGSSHAAIRAGIRGGLDGGERFNLWRRANRKAAAA